MENKKNQSINSSSEDEEDDSAMNKTNTSAQNTTSTNNTQIPHLAPTSNKTDSSRNINSSLNNTNNNRFILRLFACGGYCARSNRRSSNNVANSNSAYGLSKSATMIPGSSMSRINEPLSTNKPGQTTAATNASHLDTNNNTTTNSKNLQFHSQLSLSNNTNQLTVTAAESATTADTNRKQSYESIIEKILSTPTKLRASNVSGSNFKVSLLSKGAKSKSDTAEAQASAAANNNSATSASNNGATKALPKHPIRKNLLNENLKRIEHDNHKLFKKTEIITDKVCAVCYKSIHQLIVECQFNFRFILFFQKQSTAVTDSIVLPVLKINDCYLPNGNSKQVSNTNNNTSSNNNRYHSKEANSADSLSSNANMQMNNNMEDSEDYEDDEDDEDDEEDDEETEADIVAMQREVLKALRSQGDVDFDM